MDNVKSGLSITLQVAHGLGVGRVNAHDARSTPVKMQSSFNATDRDHRDGPVRYHTNDMRLSHNLVYSLRISQ